MTKEPKGRMYESLKELQDATADAVRAYISLMGSSALLLSMVDQERYRRRQQEVINEISDHLGRQPIEVEGVPVKATAKGIMENIQRYRSEMPRHDVIVFDEGLKMLEDLCRKYL